LKWDKNFKDLGSEKRQETPAAFLLPAKTECLAPALGLAW